MASSSITVTGTTSFTYSGLPQGPSTSTVTGSTGVVTYSYVGTGATSYAASATKPTNAGTYSVTATVAADANYNAASSTATAFTINKAALTVTANPQSKPYDGLVFTGFTSTITGFVNSETISVVSGAATYSGAATTATAAGSYTITPVLGTLSASNYDFTVFSNGILTIGGVNSSIIVTGTTSFTYSGLPQGPSTSTLTGSTGAVTYSYVGTGTTSYGASATKPTNAGTYSVTATVAADANYNASNSAATAFTINKAALTVTANLQSKPYDGLVFSGFTSTITGFVNSETISVVSGAATYSGAATTATAAGSYTITPVLGTLSSANYNFTTFTNGTLTINTSNSSITVTGSTSFTYTGLAQGPSISTVTGSTGAVTYSYVGTGTTSYGASATQPTNAGTYSVTATVAADANYNAANSAATAFTINKAALTVTADAQSKPYDGLVFSGFTSTITGFVNGETISVVSGAATYSGAATTATAAGSYIITPMLGTLSASNYDFATFINETLIITGGALPVTFIKFTATRNGDNVQLNWSTGSEINIKNYEIEKSANGINFNKIGTVTSLNSATGASYQKMDIYPYNGVSYYRIKSNDENGQHAYSVIAVVRFSNEGIKVSPTLISNNRFTLTLNEQPVGNYNLVLTNLAGQRIFQKKINYTGGNNTQIIELGNSYLGAGIYNLSVIETKGNYQNFRLLINNQ